MFERAFLFICLFLMQGLAVAEQSPFFACEGMPDKARLSCFDKQLAKLKYTQYRPPKAFMRSEIRTHVKRSDYDLNVKKFLQLLSTARTKDKKQIRFLGWRQQNDVFILDIKIEEPVSLVFQFHQKQGFSLLKPVDYQGTQMAAEQFILVIAAMTPF